MTSSPASKQRRCERNYRWVKDGGAKEHRYLSHHGSVLMLMKEQKTERHTVYLYRKSSMDDWQDLAIIIANTKRHVEKEMWAL